VIQRRQRRRRDGTPYFVWRVRWHDSTGAERNRTLDTRADAEAFEAKVRLAKRGGELASLDAGRETLAEFAQQWWKDFAEPNLETATLKTYASVWNRHALPRLGSYRLRELTPAVVAGFRQDLERARVGAASIRKTLTMLQSMLRVAVEWQLIASNPVRATRKPPVAPQRAVRPLPPAKVEELRAWLVAHRGVRDATLVSVLAYAGLRPQEALALRWSNVRERTLLVEEALAHGQLKGQKTGRPPRTVRLLQSLRQDLTEWHLAAGVPADDAFLFPGAGGGPWQLHDWQNWRRRSFAPAAKAAGLRAVPYDLRHSFASLLIHEGRLSVVEIAAELGHRPTMTLNTYGHVIAELAEAEKTSAEQLIRRARAEIRPISGPRASDVAEAAGARTQRNPAAAGPSSRWAIQDSNLGPLPYQRSALTD
jgi:integrase